MSWISRGELALVGGVLVLVVVLVLVGPGGRPY
jgi:hypothetical protein